MRNIKQEPGFISISRAWDTLVKKGICTEDSSGDPDVEALFERIAIVREKLEEFRREVANNPAYNAVSGHILSRINRILKWL